MFVTLDIHNPSYDDKATTVTRFSVKLSAQLSRHALRTRLEESSSSSSSSNSSSSSSSSREFVTELRIPRIFSDSPG